MLSGGGVFLPSEIRESIGLEPLDSVEFTLCRDTIVIRKVHQPVDAAKSDVTLTGDSESSVTITSGSSPESGASQTGDDCAQSPSAAEPPGAGDQPDL